MNYFVYFRTTKTNKSYVNNYCVCACYKLKFLIFSIIEYQNLVFIFIPFSYVSENVSIIWQGLLIHKMKIIHNH